MFRNVTVVDFNNFLEERLEEEIVGKMSFEDNYYIQCRSCPNTSGWYK